MFLRIVVWSLILMIKCSVAYNSYNNITIKTVSSSNSVLISGTSTGSSFASPLSDLGDINHNSTADIFMSASISSTLSRSRHGIIYVLYETTNDELFQTKLTTFVSEEVPVNQNGVHDLIIVIHGTCYFYNGTTGFKILRETVNNRIGLSLHSSGDANQNGDMNIGVPYVSNPTFCNWAEHRVMVCEINKDFTSLLQKSLGQESQPSCSMLDNSIPEIITTLQSNQNQTYFAFCPKILIISIVLLCGWLRIVQSDSSTGGAGSSCALEILQKIEKIRYVFQHYPSYFIDVSYILYFLYVYIVS